MEHRIDSYGSRTCIVKKFGSGAHVVIPKAWIGLSVKVLLLEPEDEKKILGGC